MVVRFWIILACVAVSCLNAQDFKGVIKDNQQRPVMAIPDLRGTGDAEKFMAAFNQTLWSDIEGSGLFRMAPKTMYPRFIPQQPDDFLQGRARMQDWGGPPAAANYLAFGYTAVQNGVFVLYGTLYDLGRANPSTAQAIGARYVGPADETGARKTAHQFAADILALFGGKSLFGTRIYFVSTRTGNQEIWVMDPDGSNQRQLTKFNTFTKEPAISQDGTKLAVARQAAAWEVNLFSVDPFRQLPFRNQKASLNSTPSFTPDGKQVVYSSSAGGCCRIFIADLDGSNSKPLNLEESINVEPTVNPKSGNQIAFVSDRSGHPQIYTMNMDGTDVERVTNGQGEATNPSWHPGGQLIAFAWTQGFAPGNFNIFYMDVVAQKPIQLTHGEGKNENPSWAPDGVHIVFGSNRSGSYQIWTMLADGSQAHQLTTQGNNMSPVWGQ